MLPTITHDAPKTLQPADPAAHMHISVSRAGTRRVYVEANAGPSFFAIPAAPARDIERHGNQVAYLDEFDVPSSLDHFTRDLMAKDQPGRRRRSAADHMLIAAANISGDDLQDDAVLALAIPDRQFRVIDGLHLDLAGCDISYAAIGWH